MAQYIMEEMPDIHKTGERVLYPRFAMIDQIDFNGLVRRITDTSGFKPGEIEGILKQAALEMAKLMANGCSVKLDGIGKFTTPQARLVKWMFTTVFVTLDGEHAVDGLVYSPEKKLK